MIPQCIPGIPFVFCWIFKGKIFSFHAYIFYISVVGVEKNPIVVDNRHTVLLLQHQWYQSNLAMRFLPLISLNFPFKKTTSLNFLEVRFSTWFFPRCFMIFPVISLCLLVKISIHVGFRDGHPRSPRSPAPGLPERRWTVLHTHSQGLWKAREPRLQI